MLDKIAPIAFVGLLVLGILMVAAPNLLIREDKRDDPSAIEQIRKTGYACLAFAAGAALLSLKYTLL